MSGNNYVGRAPEAGLDHLPGSEDCDGALTVHHLGDGSDQRFE
jgi:hypothetical protein